MLTPSDPDLFRSEVLRRAARIERRRRRARVLLALPALVAGALLAVVIQQREPHRASVAASDPADVVTVEEIALPAGAVPWSVIGGADRAMWVLVRGTNPAVVRLAPSGEATTHPLPADARPDVVVAGTDGGIWATDPPSSRVLRLAVDDGTVTSWPTESSPSPSATWLAGRLWFAEPGLDRVTGMAADGDTVHLATPRGRAPAVVAAGPDGSVWYASSTSSTIGSISSSGTVNELDLGEPDARAAAMTSGPGPALWLLIARPDGTRLAHVDAEANVVGDDLAPPASPGAISPGPDGRLWFSAGDATVQQQSLSKLTIIRVGRPLDADAWALAPDDSMWAVDRGRELVVRISLR